MEFSCIVPANKVVAIFGQKNPTRRQRIGRNGPQFPTSDEIPRAPGVERATGIV
jgi:hypothetical protein